MSLLFFAQRICDSRLCSLHNLRHRMLCTTVSSDLPDSTFFSSAAEDVWAAIGLNARGGLPITEIFNAINHGLDKHLISWA